MGCCGLRAVMGKAPIQAAGNAPAAVLLRTNSALFFARQGLLVQMSWLDANADIVHQIVILLDFPSGKFLRFVIFLLDRIGALC